MKAEYVRNLNCNYQRLEPGEQPDEKRYQYCIMERGGFRHLLSCDVRKEDGKTYLYYDISSTQNLVQLFMGTVIDRDWMKHFLWGLRELKEELRRYLLEDTCVVFHPEYIYQDLEKNNFYFTYIPYYNGGQQFKELLDFIIDRMDYHDECLVEFVYKAYEKYRVAGIGYSASEMEEDFQRIIERELLRKMSMPVSPAMNIYATEVKRQSSPAINEKEEEYLGQAQGEPQKKGIFRFLVNRAKREQEEDDMYRESIRRHVQGYPAVNEKEVPYITNFSPSVSGCLHTPMEEEEYGKTIYIEETKPKEVHGLYNMRGELVMKLDSEPLIIGKRKDSASFVLNDYSASRIHARIFLEGSTYYIEDLNSTNGTYTNGIRMQPYERRSLEVEDELRFAKSEFIFR